MQAFRKVSQSVGVSDRILLARKEEEPKMAYLIAKILDWTNNPELICVLRVINIFSLPQYEYFKLIDVLG